MEFADNEDSDATQTKARTLLASVILLVWVLAIVSSFWHFQLRYSTAWITFDGSRMQQQNVALVPGKLSVVHFIDASCPCSRFSLPHIAELEQAIGHDTVSYQKVNKIEPNTLTSSPP